MKRTVEVWTEGVRVKATIDTDGRGLMRSEVEKIRDRLATRLQDALAELPYIATERANVRVR